MINPKEIIERAVHFSKEWKAASRENSDKQTFWNEFFYVFGIDRKRVAKFEETVKKYSGSSGFVDLFWKGELIVEHKSKGEDLDDAYQQALEYSDNLKKRDKPKHIIVSDFQLIRIYDNVSSIGTYEELKLEELPKKTELFGFLSGYIRRKYKEEEPVNKKAAELVGDLHEVLLISKYDGDDLERLLVRILFCLFADDTTIFPKGIFREFVDEETNEDGFNCGSQLIHLFQVLNTPYSERQNTLSEKLSVFPYVNGDLFSYQILTPSFNKNMRDILLECCHFDWSQISPAIFGTMFQAIIHGVKRDELGAHYTSEQNIMKVLHGLFLDDLNEEFEKNRNNINKLKEFHNKIASIKILDPACGCGNFLVIAYREIRLIEIKILKQERDLSRSIQLSLAVLQSQIQLDSFFGIEYDKSAVRITELAMWLMEHKINDLVTGEFGKYIPTIPLKKSPHILCGNALRTDWNNLIKSSELTYIIGNPPFISKQDRSVEQKEDMKIIFGEDSVLDYVSAWYIKSLTFIQNNPIKVAFVSTNSITQGEQAGVLWENLLSFKTKIHFAHRTFKWGNEAKGKAQVFVVIIGFSNFDISNKYIYEYLSAGSEPLRKKVRNINPYLIDFDDIVIKNRTEPIISNIPNIVFGNMPNDDGNLLLTTVEKEDLIKYEPEAAKFIRPLVSAKEFLNGMERWCLWLKDVEPKEFRHCKKIMERIEKVKDYRLKSTRAATIKLAATPTLFGEVRQPTSTYILIPRHCSENRIYIPIGYFSTDTIVADSCLAIPNSSMFHFGVITSLMHMAWMRQVCGRLKSDYRYSSNLVYNNFPFPTNISDRLKNDVEEHAIQILEVRKKHNGNTLADLYDPQTMPSDLLKAHRDLDKLVDKCYSRQSFTTEMERLQFLFSRYESLVSPLLTKNTRKKIKD